MYILDTDHLTLLQRQSPAGITLLQRLQNSGIQFSTTVITYEEQTRGWMANLANTKNADEEIVAYQRLQQHAINYCNIPIIAFDHSASQTFQQLRKLHPRLGHMDLKIAAITIAQNAILLTRNNRDFGQIAGITIDNWTT